MKILSKTLQLSDYDLLKDEVAAVRHVHQLTGINVPLPHEHRLWEYAMTFAAYFQWLTGVWRGTKDGSKFPIEVADFGCGTGLASPIMLWLGANVTMYEIWKFGNADVFRAVQMQQMANIQNCVRVLQSKFAEYKMVERPLGGLIAEDHDRFDVGLCVSTIEHIAQPEDAFKDLCRSIKPGGLLFLTTDFAEDSTDHYKYSYLRAGKIYNVQAMADLAKIGESMGFELFGDVEWKWDEACRLVYDYGFASLAMVRTK